MRRRRVPATLAVGLALFAFEAGAQEPVHRIGFLARSPQADIVEVWLAGFESTDCEGLCEQLAIADFPGVRIILFPPRLVARRVRGLGQHEFSLRLFGLRLNHPEMIVVEDPER